MKLLCTVALLIFSAASMAESNELKTHELPKFSPAKKHQQIQIPKADQRVAILNISLKYDKGEVLGAQLRSSQTIVSVAPKVFARQMGDWRVTIGDNVKNAFFVNNPGFLEVENKLGDQVPYHYVSRGEKLEWRLVVPLYKNGNVIDASTITVTRVRDNKVIIQAKI